MAKTSKRPPSWNKIKATRQKAVSHVPDDKFLKLLLRGCLRVGKDRKNPIRGNLVATGLREAIGHLLHSLAPDDEVRRCVWFVQAQDTKTITRRQRAKYIVQAGLPDKFVQDVLCLDVDQCAKPLLNLIDVLNKATHVRPETIVYKESSVKVILHEFLSGMNEFFTAASDSRREITEAVIDIMQSSIFDKLIAEIIQDIDILSTHSTIDDHYIDEVTITRFNSTDIHYKVEGRVEVELQYGSDSDVESDLGLRTSDSYPYSVNIECEISKPRAISSKDLSIHIDTSAYYK